MGTISANWWEFSCRTPATIKGERVNLLHQKSLFFSLFFFFPLNALQDLWDKLGGKFLAVSSLESMNFWFMTATFIIMMIPFNKTGETHIAHWLSFQYVAVLAFPKDTSWIPDPAFQKYISSSVTMAAMYYRTDKEMLYEVLFNAIPMTDETHKH